MKLSELKTTKKRRRSIEELRDIKLSSIETALVDEENQIHCENLIGAVSLPLGVAGPLLINGKEMQAEFYVPLATTEGALIASINRGAKAISQSGGVAVHIHNYGATRGPVFYTENLEQHKKLFSWIKQNETELANVAEQTSSHLTYKGAFIKSTSQYMFVRFSFDTEDAMGMNMVTIATQHMTDAIEKGTGIPCLALAGNFDIDKKAAWLNFIENRGHKAYAEVVVPQAVVKEVLKTSPEKLFEVWLGKCVYGSIMSGSLGFNAHYANIVAAFFAATGQDLAHVVEGSMGITSVKVLKNNDLYFAVYLPAIMIGTVGGGTSLKTQMEARNIIGVKSADQLTEVLVATVLAGELSLLASIAEGSLTKAHERLGR